MLQALSHTISTIAATAAIGGQHPQHQHHHEDHGEHDSHEHQMSLVTDFRWNLIDDAADARQRFYLRELALTAAAHLDPHFRIQSSVSIEDDEGDQHIHLEEAFAAYAGHENRLSARLGKFSATVGGVNRLHREQLEWLDYPLVIADLFGEHGLRATGASIAYELERGEITLEGMSVPDEGIFSGTGGRTAVAAHLRTQLSGAEVGLSYLNGPGLNQRSQVFGVDLGVNLGSRLGKATRLQAEAFWAKSGTAGAGDTFGGFAALTTEVAPRVHITGKLDYSELPNSQDLRRAWSVGATYKFSHFQHLRMEFQQLSSNFEAVRNTLNLQFQWMFGSHPAHRN